MRTPLTIALGVALLWAAPTFAGRDSSGTMSFNSVAGGYPFQAGTISRSGMNAGFAEIVTEFSDSLSRSGKGGMTAPLRCADGTAALPAFSWTSDTNTGLYRIGADNIGLSLGGTKYADFSTSGLAVTGWAAFTSTITGAGYSGGPISGTTIAGTTGTFSSTVSGTTVSASTAFRAADGTVSAPGLSFTDDTNSGIYRIGADNLGVALNGTKYLDMATTGSTFSHSVTVSSGDVTMSQAATQSVSKTGGALNVGTDDANGMSLKTNGTARITISDAGAISVNSQKIGSLADPTLAQDAATKAYADSLVAVTTTTMTAGSNWTIVGANRAAKRAGVVTLVFDSITASNGSAAWTSIATLPEGYRPGATVNFVGSCLDASASVYLCQFSISTSGVLSAFTYDNGSSLVTMFATAIGDMAQYGSVTFLAEN